jgi:DNA primase
MRVPRGFSDELRGQADIVRVVSDYVSLKKRGANYLACCPFHHEKTPSFNVNPARQIFKCFGCGKGGDVFTFVKEIESCPFPEAVKIVADKCGVPLPVMEDSRQFEERDRQREEVRALNQWAAEFFETSLTQSAEGRRALDYLAGRGVSDETRRQFHLGYAPNSWDALTNYLLERGASRTQIERSGLVTLKDTGPGFYDRFRGRLMFPICDAQGRVIAFGGRILGEGEPKYLNSPETALYTKGQHLFGLSHAREAIRRKGFAILVEGYLDFLIPYQAGVRNLVASLGTALTEQQVRLLGRYARRIVVNFDPDSAGVAATKRSLETLLAEGFKVNVLTLPDNLDPDEYIREQGAERYVKLLKGSRPFLDYIVEQAVGEHDLTKPTGKVETLNAILPYLKLVKDRVERAEYIERIADRLKIDSRPIREELRRAADTRQEKVSEQVRLAAIALKPAERKLLEILLNHAAARRRLLREIREEDYATLRTVQLFRLIAELEQGGQDPTYAALSAGLEDEDLTQELLPNLLIGAGDLDLADPAVQERLEREAVESLYSLRCGQLAERQTTLQAEINEAQRAGDVARITELTARKFELAKQEQALAQSPVSSWQASR